MDTPAAAGLRVRRSGQVVVRRYNDYRRTIDAYYEDRGATREDVTTAQERYIDALMAYRALVGR